MALSIDERRPSARPVKVWEFIGVLIPLVLGLLSLVWNASANASRIQERLTSVEKAQGSIMDSNSRRDEQISGIERQLSSVSAKLDILLSDRGRGR